eukprot:COSAG01_NODE_2366_length_7816_cov_3.797460_13_plen_278_part_00
MRRLLGGVPLLSGMDEDTLDQVQEQGRQVDYSKGEWIVNEGDVADSMIVLLSGRAQAIKGKDVMADLKAGGLVGELIVMAFIAAETAPRPSSSRPGNGSIIEDQVTSRRTMYRGASVRVTSTRACCLHIAIADFLSNPAVRHFIFGDDYAAPPPPPLSSSDDEDYGQAGGAGGATESQPLKAWGRLKSSLKGGATSKQPIALGRIFELRSRNTERRAVNFVRSAVLSSAEPMRMLYEPIEATVLRDAGWDPETTQDRNLIQVLCEMKDLGGCEILRT